jgi:hypothetical protein
MAGHLHKMLCKVWKLYKQILYYISNKMSREKRKEKQIFPADIKIFVQIKNEGVNFDGLLYNNVYSKTAFATKQRRISSEGELDLWKFFTAVLWTGSI